MCSVVVADLKVAAVTAIAFPLHSGFRGREHRLCCPGLEVVVEQRLKSCTDQILINCSIKQPNEHPQVVGILRPPLTSRIPHHPTSSTSGQILLVSMQGNERYRRHAKLTTRLPSASEVAAEWWCLSVND